MQTTNKFADEIMNFPAAGFAVASFVTPDEPQPSSSTSPLFTPEPNAPTPSAVSDDILMDDDFISPFITPSPTFYPENDFSEDNLLGLGTGTPPPFFPMGTPPPMVETFIDVSKFTKNKKCNQLMKFSIIMILSLALCYCTYTISKSKTPDRMSGFGSVDNFDDILFDIIAGK